MLGHDPARSGATSTEIRPPFARKRYRLFPDEGIMSGVQPVVAGGKVYLGTLRGIVHAIDAETGKDGQFERYLDLPWCKADLFYIQKMVMCLEAHRGLDFEDVRH